MTRKKTALITGATSGIGRAFAERFAGLGYDLIVTGRRKEVIEQAARDISEKHGVKASVVLAELSEESGVRKVLHAVEKAGPIDALVNNAGFGVNGIFEKVSAEDHIAMVGVHVDAPVRLTHAVIPGMAERGEGIVIYVSSLAAILPLPMNSVYGGTKSFLNLFAEALHLEVRGRGIKVACVCPGFTSTDFHDKMGVGTDMRRRVKRWMKPEDVVACAMKAIGKGKVICIPGAGNKILLSLVSLLPKKLYYWGVTKAFRVK